jgi:hypothetical protein
MHSARGNTAGATAYVYIQLILQTDMASMAISVDALFI